MNPEKNDPKDILDKASEALLSTPMDDEPPATAIQVALEAPLTSSNRPTEPSTKQRNIIMRIPSHTKIAVALLIILTGSLTAWLLLGSGTEASFAAVQKKIMEAKTLTFHMVAQITSPEMKDHDISLKCKTYCLEPNLIRQEMTTTMNIKGNKQKQKQIILINKADDKVLSLIPDQKTAFVFEMAGMSKIIQKQKQQDPIANLRELLANIDKNKDVRKLDEKEIDGQNVQGFRINKNSVQYDIWVAPETNHPLQIDFEMSGIMRGTMTKFEFNKELADDLFSMDVPEGYETKTQKLPVKDMTVKDVVAWLGLIAKYNNEVFPDTMSITNQLTQSIIKQRAPADKELTKDEQVAAATTFASKYTRCLLFLQQQQDMKYIGKGVTLGDKDKPVLYYTTDKGEKVTIMGNLSIKTEAAATEQPPENEDN